MGGFTSVGKWVRCEAARLDGDIWVRSGCEGVLVLRPARFCFVCEVKVGSGIGGGGGGGGGGGRVGTFIFWCRLVAFTLIRPIESKWRSVDFGDFDLPLLNTKNYLFLIPASINWIKVNIYLLFSTTMVFRLRSMLCEFVRVTLGLSLPHRESRCDLLDCKPFVKWNSALNVHMRRSFNQICLKFEE